MAASTHAVSQYSTTSQKLASRLAIHNYSNTPLSWFPWIATRLPLTDSNSILEVGAGTGELWTHIPPRSPSQPALNLTLTDFSPAMCDQLRAVPAATTVTQCDAADLPFADSTFDLVIANHMLYHLDSPSAALAEFARVLKPNGRLAVALNGRDHLQEILALGQAIGRPSAILKNAKITAENAKEYIEKDFVDVVEEVAPGDFDVPTPEPVLDYLNSWDEGPLSTKQEKSAREVIEGRIKEEGNFRIRKRMVLFTARHP